MLFCFLFLFQFLFALFADGLSAFPALVFSLLLSRLGLPFPPASLSSSGLTFFVRPLVLHFGPSSSLVLRFGLTFSLRPLAPPLFLRPLGGENFNACGESLPGRAEPSSLVSVTPFSCGTSQYRGRSASGGISRPMLVRRPEDFYRVRRKIRAFGSHPLPSTPARTLAHPRNIANIGKYCKLCKIPAGIIHIPHRNSTNMLIFLLFYPYSRWS